MNREQATKAVLKFEQSIRATQVFCLLDGTIISRVSRSIYDETLAEMESALNGQREELIRLMSEQEEVNAC